MSAKRGKFIVFEGIDGSGKSTQAKTLVNTLSERGESVHFTFEPTDRRIGKFLREILSGKENADQKTIAALFLADRLDHLTNPDDGILKLLDEGVNVICDRYYHSSYAYHSCFMDMDWVIEANSLAADLLRPDVIFFLDISIEESKKRIAENRNSTDIYENDEMLRKVHANYLLSFERTKDQENIHFVDGSRSLDTISADILEQLNDLV